MQYCSLQHLTLLPSPVTSTTRCCFCFCFLFLFLFPSLHSFWSYFSTDHQYHIGHLPAWGVHLSVSYLFTFSYCSWGSQGKNTEVVCHSLLQLTTFCQISPPWPVCLGWPHTAWPSFIELDKDVVHVIRLASFLWLWFQSVCPLMPFLSAYHLTCVTTSTLDVGCVFMDAPAKPLPTTQEKTLHMDITRWSTPKSEWLYSF